jgi:small conductance mechanosensitive channel
MNEPFSSYTNLIYDKLHHWLVAAVKMMPNFVLAILMFSLFLLLARFARKLSFRFSRRLSETPAIANLVSSVLFIIFILLGYSFH